MTCMTYVLPVAIMAIVSCDSCKCDLQCQDGIDMEARWRYDFRKRHKLAEGGEGFGEAQKVVQFRAAQLERRYGKELYLSS
jgi:hypothetical protein